MEYTHSDADLLQQPIGYWSWAASKAVVTRIRGALAEIGTTQPQFWILGQVAGAGPTKTRDEVIAVLSGYLGAGDRAIGDEIDAVVARGWIAEDADGGLEPTSDGEEFFGKGSALQKELWAERHAGISDEEYLTTLKVLQRFIHNTGGRAWHH